MKMNVLDRGASIEVNLVFPDSRVLDLDIALHFTCRDHDWRLEEKVYERAQTVYEIWHQEAFLARALFSHGWEPPTRATFDNFLLGDENYVEQAKQSTREVVKAFLVEGVNRLLITEKAKDKALKELSLVTISR